MLQTLFYVSHNGEEIGPLSLQDIRGQLKGGELLPTDFLYVEEREDWIELETYLSEEHENETPVTQPLEERRQTVVTNSGIRLMPDELHVSESPEEKQQHPATSLLPQELQSEAAPSSEELLTSAPAATGIHQLPSEDHHADEITQDTKRIPQEFSLKDGVAELRLEDLRPGRIEVVVALEGDVAKHKEELKVMGGQPHEISVKIAPFFKAGDEKPMTIEVKDEFGELCSEFSGSVHLQLDQDSPLQVTLHGPKTTHGLECCKSGDHVLKIKSVSDALKHPGELKFKVLPGEPATLKVHSEGPPRAGQPHTVKIQAFDAFGNLATTYDGPLKVEVLEHPNTARGTQDPALRIVPAPKTGS